MRTRDPLPRPMMIGLGVLLCGLVLSAGAVRLSGNVVGQAPVSHVAMDRQLRFVDLADGGIGIVDAETESLVSTVVRGGDPFLRALVRGLATRRHNAGLDEAVPFRLVAWQDGRLTLQDPATNTSLELEAFGSSNEQVFARLLPLPQRVAAHEVVR